MSESNKTIRVKANVNEDKYVNVQLNQDIDTIELLSLKIETENMYKKHVSHYGCIAGRVLANEAVGVPNVKVSVFISADTRYDETIISRIYPYKNVYGRDENNIRYNLLPDESVFDCHTAVGTFPLKRMVLDDDNMLEVYDNYYKFTTRTNDAGDYMIFGVDTGNTTLHVDLDLSDCGFLSQKPRDMMYKGYNINQFENANKFKKSNNIDNLTQIISQTTSLQVYPFWGEEEDTGEQIMITRKDINIDYKFETTCVFIGSMITDPKSEGISRKCIPTKNMGKMDTLTTGEGTIEMIRKRSDGGVEEYQIDGNQLIDGNGTWCYQIPMNLDYVASDEYGNLVPTDDPKKGVATRTRVRFRISLNDYESDYTDNHLVKILVPNNPENFEDLDYHFGSYSNDKEDGSGSFRDLFWNQVYTVKQYLPRLQKGNSQREVKFTGIKAVNVNYGNNPLPYNNMRVNLTFMFTLQCAVIKMALWLIEKANELFTKWPIKYWTKCIVVGDSLCPDLEGWYFSPGCDLNAKPGKRAWNAIKGDYVTDPKAKDMTNRDSNERICMTDNRSYLVQCIEINLAMEYKIISFDFYNDWINGMVYIPRWFAKLRRKKSYKVGERVVDETLLSCNDNRAEERWYVQQCALTYEWDENDNAFTKVVTKRGCGDTQKCHKAKGRQRRRVFKKIDNLQGGGGIVHGEETLAKEKVYYLKPAEWSYGQRVPFYATDIVLLGSLNECDKYGIPQAFKDLPATSYMMPNNLASTNMDDEGNLYGFTDGTSVCNRKKKSTEIVVHPQTFAAYDKWSSSKDYHVKFSATTEYAVTEIAGIDWGYTGPNQGEVNHDRLYQPGGHFLGMSCLYSEVNIKSCVNLQRVCEVGSEFSQREYILSKSGDTLGYSYLIPTGIIAKDNISDTNFRSAFATLNYNHLKTKTLDNGYREYDFIPIKPLNFLGELKEYTDTYVENSNSNFNEEKPFSDVPSGETSLTESGKVDAYRRTIEEFDRNYYMFRLGIKETDKQKDIAKKYLSRDGNRVSLPAYDNSYYFYFGIKDGSTALDRFFNQFFANCKTSDDDISRYEAKIVSTPTYCEGKKDLNAFNMSGSIEVNFRQSESPYTISVFKNGVTQYLGLMDSLGEQVYTISPEHFENATTALTLVKESIRFDFLDGNESGIEYVFRLSDATGYAKDVYVTMISDTPECVRQIEVTATDFSTKTFSSKRKEYWERTGAVIEGMISIPNHNTLTDENIAGFLLATDEYYGAISMVEDNPNYSDNIVNGVLLGKEKAGESKYNINSDYMYMPVWKGGDSYTVYLLYDCDGLLYPIKLTSVYVAQKTPVDIYIGDSDLLFTESILPIINNGTGKLTFYDEFVPSKTYILNDPSSYNKDASDDDKYINKNNWLQKILQGIGGINIKDKNDLLNYKGIYTNCIIKDASGKVISNLTKKQIWNLKKAFYCQDSVYDLSIVKSIKIGPTGGTPPYKEYCWGGGDRILETEEDFSYVDSTHPNYNYCNEDYKVSSNNASITREYVVSYKKYYYPSIGFSINGRRTSLFEGYVFITRNITSKYSYYKYGANPRRRMYYALRDAKEFVLGIDPTVNAVEGLSLVTPYLPFYYIGYLFLTNDSINKGEGYFMYSIINPILYPYATAENNNTYHITLSGATLNFNGHSEELKDDIWSSVTKYTAEGTLGTKINVGFRNLSTNDYTIVYDRWASGKPSLYDGGTKNDDADEYKDRADYNHYSRRRTVKSRGKGDEFNYKKNSLNELSFNVVEGCPIDYEDTTNTGMEVKELDEKITFNFFEKNDDEIYDGSTGVRYYGILNKWEYENKTLVDIIQNFWTVSGFYDDSYYTDAYYSSDSKKSHKTIENKRAWYSFLDVNGYADQDFLLLETEEVEDENGETKTQIRFRGQTLGDCVCVIGICDTFTKMTKSDNSDLNEYTDTIDEVWHYRTKHTNVLGAVRLYTKEEFEGMLQAYYGNAKFD